MENRCASVCDARFVTCCSAHWLSALPFIDICPPCMCVCMSVCVWGHAKRLVTQLSGIWIGFYVRPLEHSIKSLWSYPSSDNKLLHAFVVFIDGPPRISDCYLITVNVFFPRFTIIFSAFRNFDEEKRQSLCANQGRKQHNCKQWLGVCLIKFHQQCYDFVLSPRLVWWFRRLHLFQQTMQFTPQHTKFDVSFSNALRGSEIFNGMHPTQPEPLQQKLATI